MIDSERSVTGRLADHVSPSVLSEVVRRDLIDEVIIECGKREKRARLLPAHVVWRVNADLQLPPRRVLPDGSYLPFLIDIALTALYRRRRRLGLAFDDSEIHQNGHGRALRSKSPELVEQEIWSLLITHYVIRRVMARAGNSVKHDSEGYQHHAGDWPRHESQHQAHGDTRPPRPRIDQHDGMLRLSAKGSTDVA